MPPMKLKQSPSPQTLAASQDARLLARETLRISSNLASSPAPPAIASAPDARNVGIVDKQFVDASLRLICCEEINGRRWNYVVDNGANGRGRNGSLRAICSQTPEAPVDVILNSLIFSFHCSVLGVQVILPV